MTTWIHDETMHLAETLLSRRAEFVDVLTEVATARAARDEVERTIKAIAGASWEIERFEPEQAASIGVFLPSNNLLYSLVLFGIVPSLYCDRVLIRSSARVRPTANRLYELIADIAHPRERSADAGTRGTIELVSMSQRRFVAAVADVDAVVFTGQYENGLDVMGSIAPDTLFLMFGSGPNPVVIGPEHSVDEAVRASLAARLYNSGQDCLSADLFAVHESLFEPYVEELVRQVQAIEIGLRKDPDSVVAPLVYRDAVLDAQRYLRRHRGGLRCGGRVDLEELRVQPSVVVHDTVDELHPPEFFSPIFCVAPYRDVDQLTRWAETDEERDRGMFVSVFGEPGLAGPQFGTATVLTDEVTFDHEDGNMPFGGHGVRAGSARDRDGQLTGRPLLLSAELAAWQSA